MEASKRLRPDPIHTTVPVPAPPSELNPMLGGVSIGIGGGGGGGGWPAASSSSGSGGGASSSSGGGGSSSGGGSSCSKRKLDELFYHWLSLGETQQLISSLVDDLRAGRPLPLPAKGGGGGGGASSPSSPLSPVSKLLRNSSNGELWSPGTAAACVSTPPRSPKSPRISRVVGGAAAAAASPSPRRQRGAPPSSPRPPLSPASRRPAQGQGQGQGQGEGQGLGQGQGRPAEQIPRFYFPAGERAVSAADEAQLSGRIDELFAQAGGAIAQAEFRDVTCGVCRLPSFLNRILFEKLAGGGEAVPKAAFAEMWEAELRKGSFPSRVVAVLRSEENADFLVPSDWAPALRDLLQSHPGLEFLAETAEFQQRYVETVTVRIFHRIDRTDSGRISVRDIERSPLPAALRLIDNDEDINKELQFFSYEHFYVLYCKFWELDSDHDLEISRDELLRYGNHSLTRRIVDRIFTQAPRKFSCTTPNRMGYRDFARFCLCEEDKTNDQSIDYWFRCIDLDDDGVVSVFEMEHFYREQLYRMHCLNVEAISFVNLTCQLNDMIKPKIEAVFTPADFKKSFVRHSTPQFFNALCNLNKFIAHEQRDPFTIRQERANAHLSDWDRFAQVEYLRLAAEEEEGDTYDEQQYEPRQEAAFESPF